MRTRFVSIILPVHNQQDHVLSIISGYRQALAELPSEYEIVLVTNACRDRSPEICQQLAQSDGRIKHVDTTRGGWGHAIKVGLQVSRGDILCYTNSARTSPETLMLTLLYAHAHPDAVIKTNRKIRDNWRRRLGSLIFNLECRAFFDLPVWDVNGTPKIFPRTFGKLLSLTRDDDLIDAEFNAICRREQYPVLEVPVLSTKRHGGKSTTNYTSAMKMYWGAYELWRNMQKPTNA